MFQSRRTPHLRQTIYVGGILLLTFWIVLAGLNSKTQVERITERGILRVATLNSPLTYYYDRDLPRGYEYQLARSFADFLGVELEIEVAADPKRLFQKLDSREVDLLAANLVQLPERDLHHNAGPIYRTESFVAIYRVRRGYTPPASISDARDMKIEVLVDSGESNYLANLIENELQSQLDGSNNLRVIELTNANRLDLLTRLQNRESQLAIVPASLWKAYVTYHPELAMAFEIDGELPVSWYFGPSQDESLIERAELFFGINQTKDLLTKLESTPPPQSNPLNYFDTTSFREGVEQRYTELRPYFIEAATETGFDPLFLAAVAYQESHWRADAVSPTGVRGIMMLTEDAALDVGVDDRTDARESIIGGAKYLRKVEAKIPERIAEPDRTYFALAAYNIGFGHLEDARILTQRAGDNADLWSDVAKHLPKLEQEVYYSMTRYGQARGNEAVGYVENIKQYQRILPTEALLADIRRRPIKMPD